MEILGKFSSPFRGFYLSTGSLHLLGFYGQFSSPFRGFYLSTFPQLLLIHFCVRSRPLFEVSIFLQTYFILGYLRTVLVPFSEFLSFYTAFNNGEHVTFSFSSPFRSFYLSMECLEF